MKKETIYTIENVFFEREFATVWITQWDKDEPIGLTSKKFFYDDDMSQDEFDDWINETVKEMNNQ